MQPVGIGKIGLHGHHGDWRHGQHAIEHQPGPDQLYLGQLDASGRISTRDTPFSRESRRGESEPVQAS
jgi:hypothetical protein